MKAFFRNYSPQTRVVAGSFLLGVAATLFLWTAYPYGLVTPDTYGYVLLGRGLLHAAAPLRRLQAARERANQQPPAILE